MGLCGVLDALYYGLDEKESWRYHNMIMRKSLMYFIWFGVKTWLPVAPPVIQRYLLFVRVFYNFLK